MSWNGLKLTLMVQLIVVRVLVVEVEFVGIQGDLSKGVL